MTIMLACNCRNNFQQEKYGNKRVHNICKGANNKNKARCTACGALNELPRKSEDSK